MSAGAAEHRLGGPLPFVALAVTGTLLAMIVVIVGTGLWDGFGGRDLNRMVRRMRNALPWVLPLAALAGALLHQLYARMLRPTPSAPILLFAVIRAFVHFPYFGMLALLAAMWALVAAIGGSALRRLLRDGNAGDPTDTLITRWIGPPIWFITVPFILMKLENEGELELPQRVSRRRLLRWMPAMLAVLLLFIDAVSEETGERIDPYWLTLAASFWLADYLIVAFRVSPAMRK